MTRLILLGALLAAQQPEEHTIRISVNLVEVDAVVTDRKGNAIKDLTVDDFEVLQDGRPQRVRSAQWIAWGAPVVPPATEAPKAGGTPPPLVGGRSVDRKEVRRTIAIVIDDLGLSFESIARLRDSLKSYIRNRMQPTDLVAILTTGRSMGAMSQFTSDKRLLLAAVDHLRWNSWGRAGVSAIAPLGLSPEERVRRMSPEAGGGGFNAETDPEVMRRQMFMNGTLGAIQNIVQGLRDYPGRKSLLLISESMELNFRSQNGNPTSDNTQAWGSTQQDLMRRLADAANRNFVVIDTLDPRGLVVTGLTAADDTSGMDTQEVTQRTQNRNSDLFESQTGLSYLAAETGGQFQFNDNDLTRMVAKAADGVGGYYLISYTPDEGTFAPKEADKWHRVKVRVKRPQLLVRARSGFLGRPDTTPVSALARKPETLAEAMLSPFAASSIQVRLTGFHVEDPKTGTLVSALLHINTKDIEFEKDADGVERGSVEIVAFSLNPQGKPESQSAKVYQISLKPENAANVRKQGFLYTMYHPVKKPGGFQLRVGVRDQKSGRMGTATQYVEVPDVKKGGLVLTSMIVQATPRRTILASPAVRQFEPKSEVLWGARILNAKVDKENHPQLTREVIVYRDGKKVYQSPVQPWKEETVDDLKRLPVTGMLKFGERLPVGEYVLQVVVRDKLQTDPRKGVASQAIDFEVKAPENTGQ